jgi:hypothetical protein
MTTPAPCYRKLFQQFAFVLATTPFVSRRVYQVDPGK